MSKQLLIGLFLCLIAFQSPATEKKSEVMTLEWIELLPPEDLLKMQALPEINHEGGEDPNSDLKPLFAEDNPANQAWAEVLQSAKVKEELNGKKVRLPGFVVPIEYDEQQNVTAFFLVPYFGACIHVPPPPPNQIVYVTKATGLKADMIYNPFWVQGTLKTENMSHDLANSAYSIVADKIYEYEYE